jgi:hypothetical protein
MHKLLEKAITELAALPEDQQGLVAARLLEEMKRWRISDKRRRWARVADRLARLDALKGQSAAFAQHTRDFRDGFQLRDHHRPTT